MTAPNTALCQTGNLAQDGGFVPIQAATRIQNQDATGSPYVGGFTLTATPITMVVPPLAVSLVVCPASAIRVGDNVTLDGSGAGKGYTIVPANTPFEFACINMTNIYMRTETGSVVVGFHFKLIG